MARLQALIDMYPQVIKSDHDIVFIQINEAHSNKWPLGLTDHPEVHQSYTDRVNRAEKFVSDYNFPYRVLIDGWSDEFESTYHAWPDQYVLIDVNTGVILDMSRFDGPTEAMVTNDYADVLNRVIQTQ